jgi:mono/diheme cytochrome c family protein
MPKPFLRLPIALAASLIAVATAVAQPAAPAASAKLPLDRSFANVVQPFLEKHCLTCHGTQRQEAKLDLSRYTTLASVTNDQRVWETVLERIEAREMPPEKATRQPSAPEREAVIDWIRELRDDEARRNAGDPGPVLARRLSHAEFDYTIHDLTGVDIRPTREFPVDPANEAGFDNSGESLTMSPALVKKYLAAVRHVADHMVLKPNGFVFAPHPAVTETDRDKYCVHRIIDFYKRHQVDYADYFMAAWRFQHRAELGNANTSLSDIAAEMRLSAKYLATIWSIVSDSQPQPGPLGEVFSLWSKLPAEIDKQADLRRDCERLRDLVLSLRRKQAPPPAKMHVEHISDGSQPFVLWRNRQLAASHRRSAEDVLPADASVEVRQAYKIFCRAFPDTFVVSDRGPYFDPKGAGQGRLLTAGFHLMQGYFRDDGPLYEMVLDDTGQHELDALWRELDFVTLVPLRQYKDFIFFERAEPPRYMLEAKFDFALAADPDVVSEAKMERLREAYLAKAREIGAHDEALAAIDTYFTRMSAEIRWVEKARKDAEPSHLAELMGFTERAYRRPLSQAERDELLAFYRVLREQDQLGHEDALRDTIASVLLSPNFCYRFDLPSANGVVPAAQVASAGEAARPLSPYELASRLSYFLWSSMPDAELLSHAAAGDLTRPEVLAAQTRRMLRDDRIRRLAVEFGGNWLDMRRFEEHNAVDRERFAGFTNELRQAMYEEPIRFFVDVAQSNRSLLDFLAADYTFVNPILAKHYGIPIPQIGPDEWIRIEGTRASGRGGLLPMSVFLTKNAPGLRTSPVKRGYWVVRRLLGENIPAPPPEVPELPKDEAKLGELTLPQLLARHRDNKACAGCHQRFDAVGLAFEGYGPIGELRTVDLGGRPVENQAIFPDRSQGTGFEGLRRYLSNKRQDEFVANLCRKLLAYALGRTLLLSDKETLENMKSRLKADGYKFETLVEAIVTSRQFLKKRVNDGPDTR